jgi:hypothetical protein
MKGRILEAVDSPSELEALYRSNPKEFGRAFADAFAASPDSVSLRVWHERLFFDERAPAPTSRMSGRDIWLTVALAMIAGTLAKLPILVPALDGEKFCARNLGGILAGALIVYFCVQRKCQPGAVLAIAALFTGVLVFLNFLPGASNSATVILACLHAPFFFWSLVGVAFLGGAWRNMEGRMDFLRYNGELLIYTTIVLLGGMVLTGVTLALFHLIDVDITEWYMGNVVVYGAIASPIVATLLIEQVVSGRFKIAPLLAKVFTPLFLVTVTSYLIVMILKHKSPFTDRDFLIAFNGLLLVVLGLCIFSVSERAANATPGVVDLMNIGLVAITLVIDVVALAAILFRMSSEGLTPNRLAVLGANVLAFCHLAGILYHYIRFMRKDRGFEALDRWIVGYVPLYTAWSVIVVLGFPLAFHFR